MLGSALLYDWLYDELGPADRTAVSARLEAEGEILMREHSYWRLLSNHCLIETAALGAAGLALGPGSEPGARFIKRARERTELIIEHAPLDGAWSEGVQYWEYGTSYFLRFLEALKTTGTADYYPRYNWFKQTTYFPIYFSLPGQRKGAGRLPSSRTWRPPRTATVSSRTTPTRWPRPNRINSRGWTL